MNKRNPIILSAEWEINARHPSGEVIAFISHCHVLRFVTPMRGEYYGRGTLCGSSVQGNTEAPTEIDFIESLMVFT